VGVSVTRASWDAYFLAIASTVATRATCDRRHVGAVLVRDRTILATGFNGSVRGLPHCDEVGHLMDGGHCVRTVHAEANALVQAARHGVRVDGATCYATDSPCWSCFKLLVNAGISRVCYSRSYQTDPRVLEAARDLGVTVERLGGGEP